MVTICRLFMCILVILHPGLIYAQPIINGAGATFPSPLYFKWIDEYTKHVPSRITYRETGSSEGIRLLLARDVDFGATDVPLTDKDTNKTPEALLHIPTCIGAVAIIYNLEGNPILRLTPAVLTDIFLGKITMWSDPKIKEINPDINIRQIKINVVHRSEGSGTTFLLTDYLSQASIDWKKSIGCGQVVRWPVGIGVKENSGVASLVKKIPGSVGYVSLNYAIKNNLAAAALQNVSGFFINPAVASASAAAALDSPGGREESLINSRVAHAYPICGFTYLIVYRDQFYRDYSDERARALVGFLRWCIHEGQQYAEQLFYAPLPQATVAKVEKVIGSITYKGKSLL